MIGWSSYLPRSFLFGALAACVLVVGAHGAPQAPVRDYNLEMADEVADKILDTPQFQAKVGGGKKARIVIGDVTNNSDDESVRVDDIFSEIRDRIVSVGTARLFAPGELDVDFIIAPELQSTRAPDERGRMHRCATLQLTLTTVSGEFVTAVKARRCP